MALRPLPLKPKPPVPGQVARCRWSGDEFFATYIGPDPDWPDNRYLMRARGNTPRFSSGTEIHVIDNECIEWFDDSEAPPPEPAKFVESPS